MKKRLLLSWPHFRTKSRLIHKDTKQLNWLPLIYISQKWNKSQSPCIHIWESYQNSGEIQQRQTFTCKRSEVMKSALIWKTGRYSLQWKESMMLILLDHSAMMMVNWLILTKPAKMSSVDVTKGNITIAVSSDASSHLFQRLRPSVPLSHHPAISLERLL